MLKISCILVGGVVSVASAHVLSFHSQCPLATLSLLGIQTCSEGGDEQVTIVNSLSHGESSKKLSGGAESFVAQWSFPPVCTQTLDELDAPLCIYTSTTFAEGRGITVLTTPTTAEKMLHLPAFSQPLALRESHINEDTGRWSASSLPGRGIGLLASKPLSVSERIMAYTPVLLAPRRVTDLIASSDLEYLLKRAVDQLPTKTRTSLMGLARSYPDIAGYEVQDIIATNSFELDVGGEMHIALYPETARMNHDCGANAQYHVDHELLTHYVHAARPIDAGEEITISYSYPLTTLPLRAGSLDQTFHFKCTCRRCQDQRSDERIRKINSIEKELESRLSRPALQFPKGSSEMVLQLIDVYKQDRLDSMLSRPYEMAAKIFAAEKDTRKARKYAELAIEFLILKEGQRAAGLQEMRQIAKG